MYFFSSKIPRGRSHERLVFPHKKDKWSHWNRTCSDSDCKSLQHIMWRAKSIIQDLSALHSGQFFTDAASVMSLALSQTSFTLSSASLFLCHLVRGFAARTCNSFSARPSSSESPNYLSFSFPLWLCYCFVFSVSFLPLCTWRPFDYIREHLSYFYLICLWVHQDLLGFCLFVCFTVWINKPL